MRSSDPLYPVRHLIGDPGFPTRDDLASFCLSVGLFHGRRIAVKGKPPKKWDPWLFRTWPMLEIIAYTMEPSIRDRAEIKVFLYHYYLGGIDMITKKAAGKDPLSAIKNLSEFIPP